MRKPKKWNNKIKNNYLKLQEMQHSKRNYFLRSPQQYQNFTSS